jgi:hypothetical protein
MEDLDIVAIQETIKADFLDIELKELSGDKDFQWVWTPAKGHSGGLITGINRDAYDLEHLSLVPFSWPLWSEIRCLIIGSGFLTYMVLPNIPSRLIFLRKSKNLLSLNVFLF